MEVYFTIEGGKNHKEIGFAHIEGETMDEVIEKAKEIIKTPLDYLSDKYKENYPLPLRLRFIKDLDLCYITDKGLTKPKKKNNVNNNTMAKKDLTGGIANLLSGADQKITQQQQAAQETPEQPTKETGTTPQGEIEPTTTQDELDLINSIEDESLKKELEERLRRKRLIGRGRPRKDTDVFGKRMDGYDRTSLIINMEKWAKIKEIALIETLTLKEIVDLALDLVIERYEAKHGTVKPNQNEKPKRNLRDIF